VRPRVRVWPKIWAQDRGSRKTAKRATWGDFCATFARFFASQTGTQLARKSLEWKTKWASLVAGQRLAAASWPSLRRPTVSGGRAQSLELRAES